MFEALQTVRWAFGSTTEWVKGLDWHTIEQVRPATAIVLVILLAIIAIAGVIQLWLIYSP